MPFAVWVWKVHTQECQVFFWTSFFPCNTHLVNFALKSLSSHKITLKLWVMTSLKAINHGWRLVVATWLFNSPSHFGGPCYYYCQFQIWLPRWRYACRKSPFYIYSWLHFSLRRRVYHDMPPMPSCRHLQLCSHSTPVPMYKSIYKTFWLHDGICRPRHTRQCIRGWNKKWSQQ